MPGLTRAELKIAGDLLTAWNGDWSTNQIEVRRYPEDAQALIKAARAVTQAEKQKLRSVVVDLAASLAAAISLLERGGKKAAASDKMFEQMLLDYKNSLDRARAAINPEAKS